MSELNSTAKLFCLLLPSFQIHILSKKMSIKFPNLGNRWQFPTEPAKALILQTLSISKVPLNASSYI